MEGVGGTKFWGAWGHSAVNSGHFPSSEIHSWSIRGQWNHTATLELSLVFSTKRTPSQKVVNYSGAWATKVASRRLDDMLIDPCDKTALLSYPFGIWTGDRANYRGKSSYLVIFSMILTCLEGCGANCAGKRVPPSRKSGSE